MANTTSAKKASRGDARKTVVNRNRISRIRTFIKKVENAILNNDKNAAKEAFKNAEPEIARGVTKGVIKKNSASRKLSRLSAKIKAIA